LAVRTAAAPAAVQVHALVVRESEDDGGDGGGDGREHDGEHGSSAPADPDGALAEAAEVANIARAAIARAAIARSALSAADKASAALSAADKASVAILVQARSHLTAILPALGRAGVPIQAVALDPLDRRPGVLDVLSLTRALLYPGDRIAWLSVLRAPWCGLGLGDLEALAAHGGTLWEALGDPEALAGLSAAGRLRAARVRAALEGARDGTGRCPLRETVERAWLALGGPACVAEAEGDDVRAAFGVIEAIEADGAVPSPEELSRRLARIRSVPAAGSAPAVQVMTIHEAKGLEFDTVILPGLHRRTQGDTRPLLRWMERRGPGRDGAPGASGNGAPGASRNGAPGASRNGAPGASRMGLVLAPIPGAGGEVEPIHRYLDDVERARALNEKHRLLYVACTRARERLHLVGVARETADGIKPPLAGTLLAALWPTVAERFASAERSAAPAAAAGTPRTARDSGVAAATPGAAPTGMRLAADWTFPALPPDLLAQPVPRPAAAPAESPIVYDWAGSEARIVGKVVHALLQRIAQQGPDSWNGTMARETARRLLAQEGLSGDGAQRVSGRVAAAIERCLADPRGRWVLGAQRDARVEWELTLREGTRARRIVLDRTFVDETGVRWVVDYKTGSHAGGSLDAFLDEEQRRYRPQLERYAQALRLRDAALAIRCGLYFPLVQDPHGAGGWREWPFPAPRS
jgi:ATP-dependent exoDNAse (exonuclease V) beta subunit